MYNRYIKRILDIICAVLTLAVFWWLYLILWILVRIKLGRPVIFKQPRPGIKDENGKEQIFCLYKFRTMTDQRNDKGELLPDSDRLTKFGTKLRYWSLDELPEVINILKGDMSVIGPRPQLVYDMVFMTDKQRTRHNVKPGLSGLAQISGRNDISWEEKFAADLKYIENINFLDDCKIVLKTVVKVLQHEGISEDNQITSDNYGEILLKEGKISKKEYDMKQLDAKKIIAEAGYSCVR